MNKSLAMSDQFDRLLKSIFIKFRKNIKANTLVNKSIA